MGQDYGVVKCSEWESFQFLEKPFRRGIGISDAAEGKVGDSIWRDQLSTGLGTQLLAGRAYLNAKCVIGV